MSTLRKKFQFFILIGSLFFVIAGQSPVSAWNDGPAPCGELCCGPSGETRQPVTPQPGETCCETSGDTLCHYACSNQYYKSTICVKTCVYPTLPPAPPYNPPPEPAACPSFAQGQDCAGMNVAGTTDRGDTITVTAFSKAPVSTESNRFKRTTTFQVQKDNVRMTSSNPIEVVRVNASELPTGYTADNAEYYKASWSYKIPDIVTSGSRFRISVSNSCSALYAQSPSQTTVSLESTVKNYIVEKQLNFSKLLSPILESKLFNIKAHAQSSQSMGENALQLMPFYPTPTTTPALNPAIVTECGAVSFIVN